MLEDWQDLAGVGHRIGPEDAELTLVVFSDFECPACANFVTETYPEIQERYPGRTALVYRHWPLRQHRLAYPAARASECAAAQGRFVQFHDLLFSRPNELGITPFREFAADAGVSDLSAFDACFAKTEPVPSIEKDMEEAKRVGGTGTPTVIVNGWLFPRGLKPQLLDSIAEQFLKPQVSRKSLQLPGTG
jgi:protein-disulfide isomerase